MRRVLLVFVLIVCVNVKIFPQLKGELKERFYWAETFVLYEEYKDALPLYELLLRVNPKNDNYKYRIGQCLINIPGRKQEAISYLEAAVKNINPKYKEGRYKETRAPYDAYYYLANAYRINNELDKALATYNMFKKNLDAEIYDTSIVDQQIQSCRNAKELMKVPLFVKKENLGSVINDRYADMNPVVSGDETVMVFNKSEPFQEALYFTKKVGDKWTTPVNIIPYLGLGFENQNYATSLSDDGRELYIYRAGEDYDGNIFVTRRKNDDTWTQLEQLNENINTKFWESHATISHDGKKLYFTSNRKGTIGGLDIFVSDRDSSGNWGPARNLGPEINTPYNEETPFLGKDNKTLFFSSRGHFNMGGYDIFYSTLLDNGKWSAPLNVGYPLNGTDDDIFFNPTKDGYTGYFALIDSSGYGLSDIYRIEIFSKDHPRKFYIRGIVQVKDLIDAFSESVKVSALDRKDMNAIVVVYSDPKTGEYKFELPQGEYTLAYEARGAETIKKDLDLAFNSPRDSFQLPGTILPKADFSAEFNVGNRMNFSVVKGDTIAFPLKTEPNSILSVEHWLDQNLVKTQNFVVKDSVFVYKFVPLTGVNRLVFTLRDRFNNTTTSEIIVTRRKIVVDEKVVRPEYKKVIADKQIAAFAEMIKNLSDGDLKNVIEKSEPGKEKFGNVDDYLNFLKNEAAKNNIAASEIDKLALKVAVTNNILTQTAVDLLESKTYGELHEILKGLDINEAGIRTWSALQKYISDKSAGRIKPEDLDRIAADILAGNDTGIPVVRNKIQSFSDLSAKKAQIDQAIAAADQAGRSDLGKWLSRFYEEAIKQGITDKELADLLVAVTVTPGTDVNIYRDELASFADEPFASWLRSLDLKKERINSPRDLILYLLKNRNKGYYTDEQLFKALGSMIASKDLSPELIKANIPVREKSKLIPVWIVLGAGIVFFFIIFFRRRRKKEDNKN
ncbi:MAG: hypothetical protein U0X39_15675 [Bacteroidales bacterium]